MKIRWLAALGITVLEVAVLAAGCASYRRKPLSPQAVDEALTAPGADALRVQSEQLRHPGLPPITLDLEDGLSPDEAAVLAVLVNPALRAERDRLALADAQLLQARILPNPELTAGSDIPVGAGAGLVNAFSGWLGMGINEFLTRRSRIEAARGERASVVLDIAWLEWQAAEAAKTALYGLVGLGTRERLAAEADQRLEENLALVRRAAGAGHLTATDLAAAEAAGAAARADLLETRAALDAQRNTLNRLLGLSDSVEVIPQAGIELPDHVDSIPETDLERHLEDRRLDLQALRQGYESQEASLRVAVLGRFPRLSIGIGRSRDTGGVTTNGLSFTVELPLFDRNQGPIAAATATRQRLFDEYTNRVFEARADVARTAAAVRSLNDQLRAARESDIAFRALEETYRAALARGQVDALDYVTAWSNYHTARLRELVLKGQLLEARVGLELASGLYEVDVTAPRTPTDAPLVGAEEP